MIAKVRLSRKAQIGPVGGGRAADDHAAGPIEQKQIVQPRHCMDESRHRFVQALALERLCAFALCSLRHREQHAVDRLKRIRRLLRERTGEVFGFEAGDGDRDATLVKGPDNRQSDDDAADQNRSGDEPAAEGQLQPARSHVGGERGTISLRRSNPHPLYIGQEGAE